MMIKSFKVEDRVYATHTLRNNNIGIKNSPTRGLFNGTLSQQLIHLLLNNEMISRSSTYVKPPEIMEYQRVTPKLKMVTPHCIEHKPIGGNASTMIQEFRKGTKLLNRRRLTNQKPCNFAYVLLP